MTRLALLSLLAACGTKAVPPPAQPEPVLSEQAQCERVAERTVDRFLVAAAAGWEYPDVAQPPASKLREERAMFVTVVFDSCFAEWPSAARSCYLTAATDAPIESCPLGDELRSKAIRRAATLMLSLSS